MNRRDFLSTMSAMAGATAAARGADLLSRVRDIPARDAARAAHPTPTAPQLDWQRGELALFHHFGVNTFTDREWGDGHEDPAIFNPARFDARQWARAARGAGARTAILTAKHHDGFCLWPTATTRHSVASSPWRGGQGDVVREFVGACRTESLGAGLYLSPWDRNAAVYGDSPRYNDFYCDQLTELLTNYGPVVEVWFDGANGEGPNGKKQTYDWPRVWALVRRLQPDAVIFSDAGPDVRWIGNERGIAAETNWATVDPSVVPYPGASGDGVTSMLQHGDPTGTAWRAGECDVSIRPGWFYHAAEDDKVKSPADLAQLFLTSTGRNAKLLLNVPPTRDGLLHDTDVAHLAGMRAALDSMFARDAAAGRHAQWTIIGARSATLDVDLAGDVALRFADLREDVAHGQLVAAYTIDGETSGGWRRLAAGTTIGVRKIDPLDGAPVRRVRVTITDAIDAPQPIALRLYEA
jgi:alpha-L-fucosidase